MKRVLVTGASGFVGANLVRRLLTDGHETHRLLRPAHQSWRLQEIVGEVRAHEADLEDSESVRRAVMAARPDWVFHLAAYGAYPSQTGFLRMVNTNLLGCAVLGDACPETGVETFLHTRSSSEYAYQTHAPSEYTFLHP